MLKVSIKILHVLKTLIIRPVFDLIFANHPKCFQNFTVFMKPKQIYQAYLVKETPRVITYIDCKDFVKIGIEMT